MSNQQTDSTLYYDKYLKYKSKYLLLLTKSKKPNIQKGGLYYYNVHPKAGQMGEARVAASMVVTGINVALNELKQWSNYYSSTSDKVEKRDAYSQIRIIISEINRVLANAGSETRFKWEDVGSWQKGSTSTSK
jgi:hypothetical protein